MRLLSFYLLLLFISITPVLSQSPEPLEYASLHVEHGDHTVVLSLTTQSNTEFFAYVDRRQQSGDRYPASQGWIGVTWSGKPNEKFTMALLNKLHKEGWAFVNSTMAKGNQLSGNVDNFFSIQTLSKSYLLSRAVDETSKQDNGRLIETFDLPLVNGTTGLLTIRERATTLNGNRRVERVIELERDTDMGRVIVKTNANAIRPYMPDIDGSDPFVRVYQSEGEIITEHKFIGDTTTTYLHYYRAANEDLLLTRVEVVQSLTTRNGCSRNDVVQYFPQQGLIRGEATYKDCSIAVQADGKKTIWPVTIQSKRISLFDHAFGTQKFKYRRDGTMHVNY